MIYIGKSPYRVSLLGGSSDLDWFVKKEKFGICLGYSLDRYSYSVLNVLPSLSKNGILQYSNREEYKNIYEIVHPIVREVLSFFKVDEYVELKTFGFASGGEGLGGSGAFILSLISSLSVAFKMNLTIDQIIEKACFIEIDRLKKPIGKQDQYLSATKGFSSFTFFDNNNVKKNNLSILKEQTLRRLTDDFYLIPTNKKRNSDYVLNKIKEEKESTEKIIAIREIASRFIEVDEKRDYKIEELFNKSVKDSWSIKKSMSKVMNQNLKEQYELIDRLIPNNWIRLIGAGNGGYFLISSKIKEQELRDLLVTQGIKGVFKANPSNEGLRGFEI